MMRLEIETDLAALKLNYKQKNELDFFLEYEQYCVHFPPIVAQEPLLKFSVDSPHERGSECMLKLAVHCYYDSWEQKEQTYTTCKFKLDQEEIDDFFDENFAVKVRVHEVLDEKFLALPNILITLDTGYIEGLRAVIQTDKLSIDTPLEPFESNVSAIANSIVVSDAKEVYLALRLVFESFFVDLFVCHIVFEQTYGQTIAINAELQDYSEIFKIRSFLALGKEDVEINPVLTEQCIRSLGARHPSLFGDAMLLPKDRLFAHFKGAFRRIKQIKAQVQPEKMTARLFLNQTYPVNYYQINKFNAFGKSFRKPNSPFLIFNFSACDSLRNSWILLTRDDGKISSHVSTCLDPTTPLKIDFIDCKNCVCYFRQKRQLYPSLPELLALFSEDIPVEERLKRILEIHLTIVVVVNEKEFFKLPISLQSYEDSIIGSIMQGSQYKIQLEVRYTGIVITFTFNFQVFDPDLEAYMKQRAAPLKEMPLVPKVPPVDPERNGAKTAQGEPHKRVRVKKIIRKAGKGNMAIESDAKTQIEDSMGDMCDHLGSDSLELEDAAKKDDNERPLKRRKRIVKKRRPALSEDGIPHSVPPQIPQRSARDEFALPALSPRRLKK